MCACVCGGGERCRRAVRMLANTEGKMGEAVCRLVLDKRTSAFRNYG